MTLIDPELLRRQLDEQLRRTVELAYQHYLTNVHALDTVVRAQSEIAAAALPPLPLAGLLATLRADPFLLPAAADPAPPATEPPPAPAAVPPVPAAPPTPAPAEPSRVPPPPPPPAAAGPPTARAKAKRLKAEPFEVYDAILAVLDRLGDTFDKHDLCRVLGYQPKKSNLNDTLFELVKNEEIEIESVSMGNKPTRFRKAGAGEAKAAE